MDVKLKSIDFGETDGKSEAEKENFLSLFYTGNNHYDRLNDENCFIISGYKGTGKTILANYFLKRKTLENKAMVKSLNSTDFIQEKLLSFSKSEITKEELVIFWKYVYLREIGFLIRDRSSKSFLFRILNKKKLTSLECLLNDAQMIIASAEEIKQDITKTKASTDVKLGLTKQLGIDLNSSLLEEAELHNGSKMQMIKAEYTEIIKKLEGIVFSLIKPKHEYYILYDDMDQLDESGDRNEFINLMKQMLYAAESINQIFREKKLKCRVIHAVRSDVLSLVVSDSYNLFKTVTDFGTEIDWYADSQRRPEKHPLMRMILHKVKSSNKNYETLSDKDVYKELFDRDENVLDFVLRNSLGRPRELVKYLSIVKQYNPEATKITIEMLKECLPVYSKFFYESLMSEVSLSLDIENIKKLFTIIQVRGTKSMTVNKLENFAKSKHLEIPQNTLEILRSMYEMGIIGLMYGHGKVQFHYRSNAPMVPNESTKFIVHYGLLKYLNIN